jgi:hypothetical protein
MKHEILLNRMYSGDFLTTDGNIGHEVINLFKDDKGRNFIYTLPDGSIAKEHNNRIKAILLVRWVGNHTMEILAKAEELTQIISRNSSGRNDRPQLHKQQVQCNDDDLYIDGIECEKCKKTVKHLRCGEDPSDVYMYYDVVLDKRFY